VTVRLITYIDDYYGMSQRDVEMARQISAVARRLGLAADPSAVQSLLVIPGATSTAEPGLWFEQMNQPGRFDSIPKQSWLPSRSATAKSRMPYG
jgi:4a-hydroxytetrahydrobiopterin dehydratase